MFNIGIRVDADNFTTETQAVVSDLQQTLNKNGITVPVNLNNATLKEMDQFIQSIGGSMKITKDALTGFIENISVNVPKANGQILSLNQGVQAVTNTVTDLNGVSQQVFSHFETTDITTTMNGMNTSLERAKELQNDIIKLYEQRVNLEHQMATALVQGDSKQQASLQSKLTKNEALDGMYREQLAYLQQQANAEGVQINLWDKINTSVSQIDGNTAGWTRTLTQSGQDAIALAQNLNQSKKVLNDFADTYKKAMSTDGSKGQMLVQDLNNMKAQVDVVINAMTNLGATVDSTGAHYQGNITAVQELCTEYNKITRRLQEFNAQKQDQQNDTQMIEQTVQAYKAYRDQLDRINKLKKENATGVDMRAEQQQLDALKTSYKNLEQGILSNGEAVYKNTQYNRDKNQVTRDSIQAQKELNVTLQDNSLQSLIADTITYTVSLQSLQQVIQSVISETVSLNDSMTQIRLVTQGSSESTKALMSDYSEIAKQLGTTTSAVADSAVEWLRQGNTIEETSELVKASTTLSVIGAMDASDATTALTASLNGYKMEASDAMKIVDQLTTLDLKYATSSGDIANALSRVASSASAAGVPLERMEAIITVTADQTQQAAETIGRAWNSVIQRINKISAGKDVSDTGKSLNDVEKALKTVGIALRDDNGIIKASSDILDEVAAKWDTWNRNQQSQIATAIAGTNQANIFRATMNDYKEVLEATTIAENANGSATERMSIYTESLTAKINTFKTTWTELVNDLNLDSLIGLVVDLGTKLLEILNILLNKIPVLSDVLKGFITVQSINILAGAVIKAMNRIAGPEGIKGLLTGLVNLKDVMDNVALYAYSFGDEFIKAGGGVQGFVAALRYISPASLAAIQPMTLVAAAVVALTTALTAGIIAWNKYNSAEAKLDRAKSKLDSDKESLEETGQKLDEINSKIDEIDKSNMTISEQKQLDLLNQEKEALEKIRETKQGIVDDDEAAYNKQRKQQLDDIYGGYTNSVDDAYNSKKLQDINWSGGNDNYYSTYDVENANIQELLANAKILYEQKEKLIQQGKVESQEYKDLEEQEKQNNLAIQEQIPSLIQVQSEYEELGGKANDTYKNITNLILEAKQQTDPASWAKINLADVIDTDGFISKLDATSSEAFNQIHAQALKTAREIVDDPELSQEWSKHFNIDLSTEEGWKSLVNIIQNELTNAFNDATDSAHEFKSASDVFNDYITIASDMEEQQTLLNKALGEMQYNGELSSGTVQKLIEKYPELSDKIEVNNGKLQLESQYLNETWQAQQQAARDKVKSQIDETNDTIKCIKTRIQAYMDEAQAIKTMYSGVDLSNAANAAAATGDINRARQLGDMITRQQQEQTKNEKSLQELQSILDNMNFTDLTPTKPSGYSSGKKSGSGSKTDPEKEAYELKKSEIELVQKQLELEKSKLEQQKKGIEQQKSALELDKSQVELQKQIKEQQLDIIEDAEDGIDDIIELIKKMTKQDYENLKTKLTEVKDYIGDFKDALDDVKDTYDDLVDDAKDKLKAEKEAADNQKKLEDGAKSIAEIQAQLAEIQYDDSADAQAKRLELTASLNEKQQDLEDEMKDQAYDAATDALDKTKDKVDNIFDAIGDILDASQDAIADYITYISDELESDGNLYKAAVAQFNDTSEGAQEELYNRLIDYNNKYGDSINKTVTEPWNEAIAAVEKYKEVAGSADIDTVRQYLGSQDTQLNASIKLDEQTIDGLDNQIDKIKIDMDKVDQQVTQFEQAISQVKDALSQLEIDYKQTSNSSDSSEQGAGGTGNEYAYGLLKGLLAEAGVDTSTLPDTYQGFIDALKATTDAANDTAKAVTDLGEKSETTGDQTEDSGDKAEMAGDQADKTAQPLTDLADSGQEAATALGEVATAAPAASTGGSSGFNFGDIAKFLMGGDPSSFIQKFATKAITKYLPKLIKAGASMVGKLHDGTDEVKKKDSWLDRMLGLGQDETARILKVGEAVIPDYANDALNSASSISPIRSITSTPDVSNIKTTNSSSINIDMGDMDFSGIDTTELRNELESIKKDSANQVYSTLYKYVKVGGYRNVKIRHS